MNNLKKEGHTEAWVSVSYSTQKTSFYPVVLMSCKQKTNIKHDQEYDFYEKVFLKTNPSLNELAESLFHKC